MKVAILNDCSAYHCGSAEVITLLKSLIKESNHKLTQTIYRPNLQFGIIKKDSTVVNIIDKNDIIIVNGEGAFHDDNKIISNIGELMKDAKNKGKTTVLCNSVWQNNKKTKEYLKYFDKIFVREECSLKEIEQDGFEAKILPDITCLSQSINGTKEYDIGFGADIMNLSLKKPIDEKCKGLPRINIFDYQRMGFKRFIKDIGKYKKIVSGRHHTFIACCKAKTKCIPVVGNSHKLKGILKNAKANILIIEKEEDYDKAIQFIDTPEADVEYKKLYDYVNSFKMQDYKDIL